MPEKRPRDARDRREAAVERERGDDRAAESQRKAADGHGDVAAAAEALRRADVAIEGERSAQRAPGVPPAESETTLPGVAGDSPPQTAELDALIAEAVNHAAAAAEAAHDAAEMAIEIVRGLAALLEERSWKTDVEAAPRADTPAGDEPVDGLPADVWEVAVLDAHVAGVSVADYLRDAVLSFSAGSQAPADSELDARLSAARREAARLLAQSRAVQAQNAQVARRVSRASAANPPSGGRLRRDGDGG